MQKLCLLFSTKIPKKATSAWTHILWHRMKNRRMRYCAIPHLNTANPIFRFPAVNFSSWKYILIFLLLCWRGLHCSKVLLLHFLKSQALPAAGTRFVTARLCPVAAVWRATLMASSWWMESPSAAATPAPHGPASSTSWQTTVLTTTTISSQRS